MQNDIKKLLPAVAATLNMYLLMNQNVYHNEVAMIHGLPPCYGNWANHILQQIFNELDREDARAKLPLRTSIVIRSDTKRPGIGFYQSLSIRKHIRVVTEKEKESAYQAERAKAVAHAKATHLATA